MIEIPEISEGKVLTAVEANTAPPEKCSDCVLWVKEVKQCAFPNMACRGATRKDGKNVIFKLLDYKPKDCSTCNHATRWHNGIGDGCLRNDEPSEYCCDYYSSKEAT